jgi:hypothetical protein
MIGLTAWTSMAEDAEMPPSDGADLVTVARFGEAWEAHIFRARLEVEGIFATVADEHLVTANWFLSGAVGGVRVQVREKDLAVAREIEAAMRRGDYAIADEQEEGEPTPACPQCGSVDIGPATGGRKAALLVFWLVQIPLPFSRHRLACGACGHTWRG